MPCHLRNDMLVLVTEGLSLKDELFWPVFYAYACPQGPKNTWLACGRKMVYTLKARCLSVTFSAGSSATSSPWVSRYLSRHLPTHPPKLGSGLPMLQRNTASNLKIVKRTKRGESFSPKPPKPPNHRCLNDTSEEKTKKKDMVMKKDTDSYIIFSHSLALRNLIFPPPLLRSTSSMAPSPWRSSPPFPCRPKRQKISDRRHPDRQTLPVSVLLQCWCPKDRLPRG